jgi:integral membrane protein
MAYAVGVGLLVIVLVGMPLEYAAGRPEVVNVVGPLHGFLYIVYLVAAADLTRRAGWRMSSLVPVILAGLVPFLTFVIERRVTRRAEKALELTKL